MSSKKLILSVLMIPFIFFTSCGQNEASSQKKEIIPRAEKAPPSKHNTLHPYGGWSCPDNIFGFPAVDLKDWKNIPIVNGRLPSKEETQNGTSLMYFDTTEIPDARPLDMHMPRLARYYSTYTQKNEMVIVIQVVVADEDTVVGFRYLNGGNGSAWFSEVNFLSDQEMEELEPTPFVSTNVEILATPDRVWEIITSSKYAKALGEMFDKNAYVESDWEKGSEVHFKYLPDSTANTGIVTASWKNLYIQLDYNFDGYHYVEKFLLIKDKEFKFFQDNNIPRTQLHIVTGPYGEDFEAQKIVWSNWLQQVKKLSEGK